jgi:hypothetical protein
MKYLALGFAAAAVLLAFAASDAQAQWGKGGYGHGYSQAYGYGGHDGYGLLGGHYGYPNQGFGYGWGHHACCGPQPVWDTHRAIYRVPILPPPAYNPGPPTPAVTYPYYTVRGPRDFLMDNPPDLGP